MRSKLTIAAIVAITLAAGSVALGSANSTSGSSSQRATEVIKLFAKTFQFAEIDLGTPGLSLGDQTVFSDDVSQEKGSPTIGFSGVVCSVVRIGEHASTVTVQCAATLSLHEGQIASQGLITFTEDPGASTFVIPITGGSGVFKNARGQVTVEEISETEANLMLEVLGSKGN